MLPIPEGFEPFLIAGSVPERCFETLIGPLHIRKGAGSCTLGLLLEPDHCNFQGTAHGGFVATFCDIALAIAMACESGCAHGATISLTIDYIGTAQRGEWLESRVEVLKSSGGVTFARCLITTGSRTVASASGVFKIPRMPQPPSRGA